MNNQESNKNVRGCCEHSRTVQKYMIYQIQHTTAPIVYHIGAGNDRQSKVIV